MRSLIIGSTFVFATIAACGSGETTQTVSTPTAIASTSVSVSALAPAPSLAPAGEPVTAYLPDKCRWRAFGKVPELYSLLDADARKLAVDELTDPNSAPKMAFIPLLLQAIGDGSNPSTTPRAIAYCMINWSQWVAVINVSRYPDIDALESDVRAIVNNASKAATAAPIVMRERFEGIPVVSIEASANVQGWATLAAADTVVVGFNLPLQREMLQPHTPTWALDPATIFASITGDRDSWQILLFDRPGGIELTATKPATPDDPFPIVPFAKRYLHRHWPAFAMATDSWHLEGNPEHLKVTIPRSAFVTQPVDPAANLREDVDTLCEPWKVLPRLSYDIGRRSPGYPADIGTIAESLREDVATREVRDLVHSINDDKATVAKAKTVRDFAQNHGRNACPLADFIEWSMLCAGPLEDVLAKLPKESPVAKDVVAQSKAARPAYVQKRAKEVHITYCAPGVRTSPSVVPAASVRRPRK